MKNSITTLIITAFGLLLLTGCGEEDLAAKKKALQEVKAKQVELKAKIAKLETEIAALDTSTTTIKTTSIEVMELGKTDFNHYVEIHGVVEASKNILAQPEASGRITSIKVREGQRVSRGDVIATIDASILRKNIEELRKSLEFVTTVFNKQKKLNDKGVGTEMQFLEAKNQKESLEKKLNTLNSQLAKYNVVAPISGIIDEILPKIGEMASPQMPIVRIVNLDKVFVSADVSEALLGKVKENDEVAVSFPNLDKLVKGKIVQTGNFINANNRTFKLKIDLAEQNGMFKPNLLTIIKLNDYASKETIVVPATTVQDDLNGSFVFVQEGNKAIKTRIQTGESFEGNIEVISGLKAGTKLIVKGFKSLVNEELVSTN